MEEDRVLAGVRKDVSAIAAVTGKDYVHIDLDGKDFQPIRYSRVYARRGGHWQVVMFQMTRIAAV
jgi:hypothetical protein